MNSFTPTNEWYDSIHELSQQITNWVDTEANITNTYKFTNSPITPGSPCLTINIPNCQDLILEPSEWNKDHVYLYAYPTLVRVVLKKYNNDLWEIKDTSGKISINHPWNSKGIMKIILDLLSPSMEMA